MLPKPLAIRPELCSNRFDGSRKVSALDLVSSMHKSPPCRLIGTATEGLQSRDLLLQFVEPLEVRSQ